MSNIHPIFADILRGHFPGVAAEELRDRAEVSNSLPAPVVHPLNFDRTEDDE